MISINLTYIWLIYYEVWMMLICWMAIPMIFSLGPLLKPRKQCKDSSLVSEQEEPIQYIIYECSLWIVTVESSHFLVEEYGLWIISYLLFIYFSGHVSLTPIVSNNLLYHMFIFLNVNYNEKHPPDYLLLWLNYIILYIWMYIYFLNEINVSWK